MKLRQRQRPNSYEGNLNKTKRSPIPTLMSLMAVAIALAMTPEKAQAEEVPKLELEASLSVGFPNAEDDSDHDDDHCDEHSDDHADHDSEDHCDQHNHEKHAPITLGVSYTFTPDFYVGEKSEEDHHHEHEEEHHHSGHPEHVIRAQVGFLVKILTIIAKIELSLPIEENEAQIGIGSSLILHPEEGHEVAVSGLVRLADKEESESWEAGFNYSILIDEGIAFSGGCIVEGHAEETHGGCGPGIVLYPGNFSFGVDTAFGPGFNHFHISVGAGWGGASGHSH